MEKDTGKEKTDTESTYNEIIDFIGGIFWAIVGLVALTFALRWFIGWLTQ